MLLLDFLADLECTGERFDKSLRQMAGRRSSLGCLGSFWDHCVVYGYGSICFWDQPRFDMLSGS